MFRNFQENTLEDKFGTEAILGEMQDAEKDAEGGGQAVLSEEDLVALAQKYQQTHKQVILVETCFPLTEEIQKLAFNCLSFFHNFQNVGIIF